MSETDKTNTEWGTRIRAGLILRRRSAEELATQLGVSLKTLQRSMRGERTPRPQESAELATVLNLPESFFNPEISAGAAVTSSEAMAEETLALIQTLRRTLNVQEARLQELVSHHASSREPA